MFTYPVDDDITLSLIEAHHAAALYAAIEASREHLRAHIAWGDRVTSVEIARQVIKQLRADLCDGSGLQTFMWYRGELAGHLGLAIRNSLSGTAELSYWLGERFTRKGIVTRSINALLDYAFGPLGLRRVIIRCAVTNPPSCAVARRLGFTHEGILRGDGFERGRPVDLNLFSLLAGEWGVMRPGTAFARRIDGDVELRLIEERHADELFAVTDANRAYLREWLPWLDSTRSVDDTRAFITGAAMKQYAGGDGFQAGIWHNGALAGMIGYHYWNFRDGVTEIGYWLAEPHTGSGVMTRAAAALVDHAFETLGLHRVEIHCAAGNTRSCAIPRRLGFTHEGLVRGAEWLHDRYVDSHIFSMLSGEWAKLAQDGRGAR